MFFLTFIDCINWLDFLFLNLIFINKFIVIITYLVILLHTKPSTKFKIYFILLLVVL